MRITTSLICAILICSLSAFATGPFVHENLESAIARGDAGEFITVSIHLTRQVTDDEKSVIPWKQDKKTRRADFVNLYKSVAEYSQASLVEYLEGLQAEGKVGNIQPLWITNTVVVEMLPSAVSALQLRNDINALHISEAYEGSLICGEVSEMPQHKSTAWGVTKIDADDIWTSPYNFTGEGVVVAVADTGCRYTHHDMRDHLWVNEDEIPDNGVDDDSNGYIDDTFGWDFELGADDNDPYDGNGHGTHTSGTVTSDGSAGNACGVAPDASLMVIRVPNQVSSEAQAKYWTAFEYITENGADVLSMSMGFVHAWNPDRYSWRDACINMVDAGVVAAIAAGNEYGYGGSYAVPYNLRTPGDVPEIISIGSTTSSDVISSFSSSGPVEWDEAAPYNDYPYPPGLTKPDVCAPGSDVFSTVRTSDTAYEGGWSGTSMATPHVGGLLALMIEARPDLTPVQLKQYLEDNALELGPAGKDNRYGSGRVRAINTIDALGANPHPDHFSITSPANEATEVVGDIDFTWESTTDPGKKSIASYTLRISEQDNFRLYDDHTGISGTTTTVNLAEGTYYWKVKAIDDDDAYTWCDERKFELTVETGTGTDDEGGNLPIAFNLAQNKPNPVNGNTTFSFAIPKTANVTLDIFDLKGRKIDTLINQNMVAGEYNYDYNANLSAGVYLYRLCADDNLAIKRMLVLK